MLLITKICSICINYLDFKLQCKVFSFYSFGVLASKKKTVKGVLKYLSKEMRNTCRNF